MFSASFAEPNSRLTAHWELRNLIADSQLNSSLQPLCMDQIESIVLNNFSIVPCISVAAETCLPSRYLAMDVSSGYTIPAFRRHVTIFIYRGL
jgi:hypothetical protein